MKKRLFAVQAVVVAIFLSTLAGCGDSSADNLPGTGGTGAAPGTGGDGGNAGEGGQGGMGGSGGAGGEGGAGGAWGALEIKAVDACMDPIGVDEPILVVGRHYHDVPVCVEILLAKGDDAGGSDLIVPEGWRVEFLRAFAERCKDGRPENAKLPVAGTGKIDIIGWMGADRIPSIVTVEASFDFDPDEDFPFQRVSMEDLEIFINDRCDLIRQ